MVSANIINGVEINKKAYGLYVSLFLCIAGVVIVSSGADDGGNLTF